MLAATASPVVSDTRYARPSGVWGIGQQAARGGRIVPVERGVVVQRGAPAVPSSVARILPFRAPAQWRADQTAPRNRASGPLGEGDSPVRGALARAQAHAARTVEQVDDLVQLSRRLDRLVRRALPPGHPLAAEAGELLTSLRLRAAIVAACHGALAESGGTRPRQQPRMGRAPR